MVAFLEYNFLIINSGFIQLHHRILKLIADTGNWRYYNDSKQSATLIESELKGLRLFTARKADESQANAEVIMRKSTMITGLILAAAVLLGIAIAIPITRSIRIPLTRLDLWGDTVNLARRMESHGVAGQIHVSEAVYKRVKDRFRVEPRGDIEIKGKGPEQPKSRRA
jgi:hypothetical protein